MSMKMMTSTMVVVGAQNRVGGPLDPVITGPTSTTRKARAPLDHRTETEDADMENSHSGSAFI